MVERKILLRFDDICPTMNWNQWEKAKLLMDKTGVTALLGVIPDCQDPDLLIDESRPDFWEYIKGLQQQGYILAMHGLHHVFELKADGLVTKDKISEFAGLPYDVQLEKIQKGKKILQSHGINTDVFFAPAHSYDNNTLKALSACGFHYVSDGLSQKPYIKHGIILLPCRHGGVPRLKDKDKYLTVVLHAHEWDREDKVIEFEKFKELFNEHSSEMVSFEEFSKWPKTSFIFGRFNELLYSFIVRKILPVIIFLRSRIIK